MLMSFKRDCRGGGMRESRLVWWFVWLWDPWWN